MALPLIVIVAPFHDEHADAVVARLYERCRLIRIDPNELPADVSYSSTSNICKLNGIHFSPQDVSGLFCRYALDQSPKSSHLNAIESFSYAERWAALIGILYLIPRSRWLNFPIYEHVAEGKIYPLSLAQQYGIATPDYLVTTAQSELIAFHTAHKRCVIKQLSDTPIAWQNNCYIDVPDFAEFETLYTANYDGRDLLAHENHDDTPTLLQTTVSKSYELRIAIVDNYAFATQIQTHDLDNVDNRLIPNRHEKPYAISADFEKKLCEFTRIALHLRVCTFDFAVDLCNEPYLLDVNPQGNWLWQDIDHGLPIANCIAEQLLIAID